MSTISLCMIVKNEEETLGRCLASIAGIPDEIIIVDTGSEDGTRQIASSYTENIYSYEWQDDFAAARNYSFALATGNYILWLDADDYIAKEERNKLAALKGMLNDSVNGVVMSYSLASDESGCSLVAGRRLKLVKRDSGCHWVGRIHEYLTFPADGVVTSDIVIRHSPKADHSSRNLRILRKWIAEEPGVTGRKLFLYANECYERRRFKQAAAAYEKLLLEPVGYREDRLVACSRLADCYRQLNDRRSRLNSLLYSLHYGPPQPDYCCLIGEWFEEREDWASAAYWYTQAVAAQRQDTGLRPITQAVLLWHPHVRLALCYARLGNLEQAYQHNELALSYLPDDPGLLSNRSKLKSVLNVQ